jgi:hypothetical protein
VVECLLTCTKPWVLSSARQEIWALRNLEESQVLKARGRTAQDDAGTTGTAQMKVKLSNHGS